MFDPINGADAFTHSELYSTAKRLRSTQRAPPVADENLEETLSAIRRARAANALRQIREMARERGLDKMSEEEIQAEIDAVRRERAT